MLDPASPGAFSSSRAAAQLGFVLLLAGVSRSGLSALALDHANSGFFVPLRSFVHLELSFLLAGLAIVGFSMLPQSFIYPRECFAFVGIKLAGVLDICNGLHVL